MRFIGVVERAQSRSSAPRSYQSVISRIDDHEKRVTPDVRAPLLRGRCLFSTAMCQHSNVKGAADTGPRRVRR